MRSIDGAVRFSVWDDWELLEEYDTSNVRQAAYLQGAHGVVKSLVNNVYYYQDKLGSTTHVADGSGHLLESYRYDLYGTPSYFDSTSQPINSSAVGVTDLYAGERWIGELALYDLRNRFMSPELGRFLQTDPIGFQGDASNLYRYCHNDPEDFSDPTGLLDMWRSLMGFYIGNPSMDEVRDAWNERRAAGKDGGNSVGAGRRDMAGVAEDMAASNTTRYRNTGIFGQDTHCNELPGDAAELSGRVRPLVAVRTFLHDNDPMVRGAVSHELADPKVKIPHWSGPRPLSEARRNDIIAQQHGTAGHSGIVRSLRPGEQTISVKTREGGGMVKISDWGFRPKGQNGESPHDPPPVVRHYLGGDSGNW